MARTPKVVDDRREQIISAAMHVFAQKGFARATNKDVAQRAGITAGLIYHYFDSKEALLMAVIEARSPLKLLSAIPDATLALPPEQFLPFIIRQILHVVETENFISLIKVILPEMLNNEQSQLAQIVSSALQRALHFLNDYIDTQVRLGNLRTNNTLLITQMFFGSVVGIVLRRQVLHDPIALAISHEQIALEVTQTFLRGLASY